MTRKEIWQGYKGWILTTVIGGTFTVIMYMGTLIIQDTDWYHQEQELIDWYDGKSKSFAVGLRVEKEFNDDGEPVINKKTGEQKTKLVYKAPDGEKYRAIYSEKGGYYYYVDDHGKTKECH